MIPSCASSNVTISSVRLVSPAPRELEDALGVLERLIPNRPSTHLHVPPTIFKRDHASIAHPSVHPTSLARASSAFAPSTRRNSRVDGERTTRFQIKRKPPRARRARVAPTAVRSRRRGHVVGSRRFASRSRRARVARASRSRLPTAATRHTPRRRRRRRRPRDDVRARTSTGRKSGTHRPTDRPTDFARAEG